MENKKIKKWEAVTITAIAPQTIDNKSKTTGKRIAIKNKNFKWDILNEQDLGVRIDLINQDYNRIDPDCK